MPVPTGGLIELTLTYDYDTETLENVYYYWNSLNNEPTSFVQISSEFDTNVATPEALIHSDLVQFINIRARTVLGNLPDLNTVPTTANGARPGDGLPSFTAVSAKLAGTTKDTRAGAKRYGGLWEGDITGNLLSVAYQAVFDTFLPNLLLPVSDGVNTYVPVIYSKPKPTRPTDFVNEVIGASRNLFATTQNSRKRAV